MGVEGYDWIGKKGKEADPHWWIIPTSTRMEWALVAFSEVLISIARNTCCDKCQEAAREAQAVLDKYGIPWQYNGESKRCCHCCEDVLCGDNMNDINYSGNWVCPNCGTRLPLSNRHCPCKYEGERE